jgi:hypothetical protein
MPFESNHPYHVKRGAVHGLISQAKVICQEQKEFNNEIENVRHDLMLSEYPQEFVDSIMKPSRSNRPSPNTVHQGTVIFPHVKGMSENF